MFAKRQSVLAATAGIPPVRRSMRENLAPVIRFLSKPPVAVAGAGLMLMGAAALFITVLGDPRAGAPSARAALKREAAVAPPTPTGLEAFSMGAYGSWQNLAAEGGVVDPALTGEAVITLPNGATVSGNGAPVTAPRVAASPLPAAPLAGLSQPGPNGLLPTIATDGRVPAQAYARPFRSNGRPRVALIVGGLGLNAVTTRAA
ncbi:MAG: divergent polysaccharide deacetylase family protein, partial [Brevundimonas sp.]